MRLPGNGISFLGDEILVTGGEGSLNQVFALAADGTWGPRESMTFARYDHACMAFNMDGERENHSSFNRSQNLTINGACALAGKIAGARSRAKV